MAHGETGTMPVVSAGEEAPGHFTDYGTEFAAENPAETGALAPFNTADPTTELGFGEDTACGQRHKTFIWNWLWQRNCFHDTFDPFSPCIV